MATLNFKSLINSFSYFQAVLVLLLLVALTAEAQSSSSCTAELSSLNVCAPFVVPGSTNPSSDCCGALQAVQTDCLCNSLRIATRLPSKCNLSPVSCDAN